MLRYTCFTYGCIRVCLRSLCCVQIPKGMSSYQADWMVGDDGEWLSGDEEDGEGSQRGPAKGPALTLSALEEKEYGTAFDGEDLDAIAEV